jgi:hypothetical protein
MSSWVRDLVYKSPKFQGSSPLEVWDDNWWVDPGIQDIVKSRMIAGDSDWIWGRPKVDLRAFNRRTREQAIVLDRPNERTNAVLQKLSDDVSWEDVFGQLSSMGYMVMKVRNPFQFTPLTWSWLERPLSNIRHPGDLDPASLLFRATEIPLPQRIRIFLRKYG